MHSFEEHSNESACRKKVRLGIEQVLYVLGLHQDLHLDRSIYQGTIWTKYMCRTLRSRILLDLFEPKHKKVFAVSSLELHSIKKDILCTYQVKGR